MIVVKGENDLELSQFGERWCCGVVGDFATQNPKLHYLSQNCLEILFYQQRQRMVSNHLGLQHAVVKMWLAIMQRRTLSLAISLQSIQRSYLIKVGNESKLCHQDPFLLLATATLGSFAFVVTYRVFAIEASIGKNHCGLLLRHYT